MNKLLASLTIALFAQAAHADMLTVDFTTRGGWGMTPAAAPSIGSLTLDLNQDGTIAAKLSTGDNQIWYGVAIDSGRPYQESDMTQGEPTGWGTAFGGFSTGLFCDACMGSASWTIGTAGQFSSVAQLIVGTSSAYGAWCYPNESRYAEHA